MADPNPFKSSAQKTIEEQNKEQVKITKDELVSSFEEVKEPYQKVSPEKTFDHNGKFRDIWYDVLTKEIQTITDDLEKVDNNTDQKKLLAIKEMIQGVKIRFNAKARGEGKENIFNLD